MTKLTQALTAGLALSVLTAVHGAQISHGGSPLSARQSLRSACPTCAVAPVDVARLALEDAQRGPDEPFRWGEPVEVDVSPDKDGVWEAVDGGRVWRMRLASAGAKSIMVTFSRFQLPVGADLFLYNDDRSVVRGAYTYLNNRADGIFAIQPTPGEAVTLEYFEPAGVRAPGELHVDSIVHDYVGIEDRSGGPGASGNCNVDAICEMGINDQMDSVVLITTPAGACCTGVLMNNTSNDGAQFVLTASHCGNLVNAVFRFDFHRPNCGSGQPSTNHTTSGSIRLIEEANQANGGRDFQLVHLTNQIPASYGVKYAGWDRSGAVPTNTLTIHHPRADYMKVSKDDDPPVPTSFEWNIVDWESGVTEGGSSGSPLFSPDLKVIGHLRAGASSCTTPQNDFYTRLQHIWDKLGPYLDPLGTGATQLDLHDPNVSPPPTTFSFTSIVPAQQPALVPGTAKTLQLIGTGFNLTTTVDLNGAPLLATRWRRMSSQRIAVDMPQLDLGQHALTVNEAGNSGTQNVTVVSPTSPVHQAGTGDCGMLGGNIVSTFGGVQLTYSGVVGHTHVVFHSTSNLPSIHPLAMFDMGNQFTQLYFSSMVTIPANGYFQENLSISAGLASTTVWSQSWCMSCGLPAQVSNLQETFVF